MKAEEEKQGIEIRKKECANIYKKALRNKTLIPSKKCENCLEDGIIHGHHKDHRCPLEVVWLCKNCHWRVHSCSKFYRADITIDTYFRGRTSKELKPKEKLSLYKRLGFDQFYEVPLHERCTKEEIDALDECERMENEYFEQAFKAQDLARHYRYQADSIRRQLNEKYPPVINKLY